MSKTPGGDVAALKVISRPIASKDEYSYSCEETHSLTNEMKTDIEVVNVGVFSRMCKYRLLGNNIYFDDMYFTFVRLYVSNFDLDEFACLKSILNDP